MAAAAVVGFGAGSGRRGKALNPSDGFNSKNRKSYAASELNGSYINYFSFSLYEQCSFLKSGTAVQQFLCINAVLVT